MVRLPRISFGNETEKEIPAMDVNCSTTTTLVAIDIAKFFHDVLIEYPDGCRRRMRIANTRADWEKLAAAVRTAGAPCQVAFEATGDYHRPLACFLDQQGYTLQLASSVAVARTRDALYNSWDKNDRRMLRSSCICSRQAPPS